MRELAEQMTPDQAAIEATKNVLADTAASLVSDGTVDPPGVGASSSTPPPAGPELGRLASAIERSNQLQLEARLNKTAQARRQRAARIEAKRQGAEVAERPITSQPGPSAPDAQQRSPGVEMQGEQSAMPTQQPAPSKAAPPVRPGPSGFPMLDSRRESTGTIWLQHMPAMKLCHLPAWDRSTAVLALCGIDPAQVSHAEVLSVLEAPPGLVANLDSAKTSALAALLQARQLNATFYAVGHAIDSAISAGELVFTGSPPGCPPGRVIGWAKFHYVSLPEVLCWVENVNSEQMRDRSSPVRDPAFQFWKAKLLAEQEFMGWPSGKAETIASADMPLGMARAARAAARDATQTPTVAPAPEPPPDIEDLDARNVRTVFRVIAALADMCGYNPEAKRQDKVGAIFDKLAELGIPIGKQETIRKVLKRAAEELPPKTREALQAKANRPNR